MQTSKTAAISPLVSSPKNHKTINLQSQMTALENQLHQQINQRLNHYRAQQNPHFDYGNFNTITGNHVPPAYGGSNP
jgi:hypothetical protein